MSGAHKREEPHDFAVPRTAAVPSSARPLSARCVSCGGGLGVRVYRIAAFVAACLCARCASRPAKEIRERIGI